MIRPQIQLERNMPVAPGAYPKKEVSWMGTRWGRWKRSTHGEGGRKRGHSWGEGEERKERAHGVRKYLEAAATVITDELDQT
jgi:hypothetical protein